MDLVGKLSPPGVSREIRPFKHALHLQELLSISLIVQAAVSRRAQPVEHSQ